jgi:hypothetical protein
MGASPRFWLKRKRAGSARSIARRWIAPSLPWSKRRDQKIVSDDGDRANAVWLPKSACEISEKSAVNGQLFHDLTLPDRLARDKGLV